MGEVPDTEPALDVYAVECEEPYPWLLLWLQRLACQVIAMVERFGKAEHVHEPVGTEDYGWDPVAPAPANI